jgi:hypothetical protein
LCGLRSVVEIRTSANFWHLHFFLRYCKMQARPKLEQLKLPDDIIIEICREIWVAYEWIVVWLSAYFITLKTPILKFKKRNITRPTQNLWSKS